MAGVRETSMLSNFTVGARVALWAGALVFVRPSVATCSPVETGLMSPTVIQIFVTELSTPVGLTEALPGFIAGAVDTSWVRDALVAVQALPTVLAPAVTWKFTRPMLGTAALSADSFVAIRTHPAFHASFVAVLVTGIMSKEVISGTTELIAAKAIVVVITGHSDLILEVGNPCVLFQCLPLPARVYHA